MPDDSGKRGKRDRQRINVNQEDERRYWAAKFGCDEQELVRAVDKVGAMADDVERELRKG